MWRESFVGKQKLKGSVCFLSDISREAVDAARVTLYGHVDPRRIRQGDCLQPWINRKFDVIISDVAGISDEVAALSEWYESVPCNAGRDGLSNTLRVAERARFSLGTRGVLIFPVISLADTLKLRASLKNMYASVEVTAPTVWPLPDEMTPHFDRLKELHDEGLITLTQKYKKLLATTSVAICSIPFPAQAWKQQ
jgi:hypothetical protein